MGSALKRSAFTRGVDLLQPQAGITGQFSCAEQQAVDDIRAQLLGAPPCSRAASAACSTCMSAFAGQGAAETGHGGRLGRAEALRFQSPAVGGIAAVHAGKQRAADPSDHRAGFRCARRRRPAAGRLRRSVRTVEHGRADMVNPRTTSHLRMRGGAGWRTGDPTFSKNTPADSDESRTARRSKARGAFSTTGRGAVEES